MHGASTLASDYGTILPLNTSNPATGNLSREFPIISWSWEAIHIARHRPNWKSLSRNGSFSQWSTYL